MNIVEILNHGIEITLKNTNELLQNKDFDRITKMFDKFISCVSSKNINRLLNYSVFDLFSMLVIARNYDDDNFRIDNIVSDLEKYRGLVNSWPTNKTYFMNLSKIIQCLVDDHDFVKTPEYEKMIQSIGFDSSLTKYSMVGAFKATEVFIQFKILYKESNNDLQTKLLSQQLIERMETISEFCRHYRDDVQEDKKEYISFYQKRNRYTKELKETIETKSITEMTSVPDEWFEYLHPAILTYVYPMINMNLEQYYNYINETIETVEKTVNDTPLTKFMFSEHIDSEIIPKEVHDSLNDTDIEKIKMNYTLLKYLGINPYEIFINYSELLKAIDSDTASKLTYLAEKNILNKNTVSNNPSLLLNNVNTITLNYDLLKDVIDFNNINYNGDILLLDSNELKGRLDVLSQYKLINSIYTFLLYNFEYLPIYDLVLENEISENLFISICFTISPIDTIKRIMLYKELSIPYLSPTNTLLSEITNPQKSNCTKEELDTFYPDTIDSNLYKSISGTKINDIVEEEIIKKLDKDYRIDNLYLIGSKPISRPKVLRNLQYIKENNLKIEKYLLTAMVSNSIINDYEINELKQVTQEKNYILL